MKVVKFGGTSVGSAARIKLLADIVFDEERKVVVLSAMSGTTNALVKITEHLYNNEKEEAKLLISNLEETYQQTVEELFDTQEFQQKGQELIASHFTYIREFTTDTFHALQEKAILAQGELLSTALFHFYLSEQGKPSVLIPALSFMRIDKDSEPDLFYIGENIKREIGQHPENKVFITQGYICRDAYGEIDNLRRGGSDYSASLIGAALKVEEIQIWTDIDGFHNNDPRFVENTSPIRRLSFDEAAELAYFGAKILHPASIHPAKLKDIPVRLKNTLEPKDEGTLITSAFERTGRKIRAIAAKDGITAVKIKSGRMLLAHGFLRKVFEVFEVYETPIDMITTSEVAVSLTIDDDSRVEHIVTDLKKYGAISIEKDLTIVCVVGDFSEDYSGIAHEVLAAIKDIPLRMISYGGSSYNISLVVQKEHKQKVLNQLSSSLF